MPSSTQAVPAYGVRSSALQATLPSSATPRTMPSPSPADRATTPFAPSAPTRKRAPTRCEPDACGHAGVTELDVAHGDAVAEVGPGGRRLLGEMEVEPAALRHVDERLRALPRDLRSVPDADDHAVDDVLHDGVDRTWHMPERASREPSAARLVAREARLVDEENAHPGPLEVDRRGRSCRPGTDDEHVETLHPAIVGRAASRGYNCAPRRGSRVAKGGGL